MKNTLRSHETVQHNNLKGFLFALGGVVLLSTNFITAKYGLKGFNPTTFSLVWTSAASLYSLIIVLITGHAKELKLPWCAFKKIFLLGLATGTGMILAWAGLALLDPSFASFLWRFSPALTIILSMLVLGERMRKIEFAPIVIMIIGGAISTLGRWHAVGLGVVLTLLSCCTVAVQMVIAKIKVAETHPNILVFYRVFIAALLIALWSTVTGKIDMNVEFSHLAITLLGAFLGPCVSFLLTFRSYKYWNLSRSSIVLTIQPIIVLPMAYIAFGKIPTSKALIGGFIILMGAFWLVWMHRPQKMQ